MFAGRLTRLIVAAVLAVGSVAYVAYRTDGGAQSAQAAAPPTIVIPRNARLVGFKTRTLTIRKGQNVRVVNNDSTTHTVTSRKTTAQGAAIFTQTLFAHSTKTLVTSKLAPGTYRFYCHIHPSMTGTLIVKGSGGGVTGAAQPFATRLRIPKVLTGSRISLPIERAKVQVFANGPATWMWTYDGMYPGPTIRRTAGQDTKLIVANKLANTFSLHLHGDHHKWVFDGQPTRYGVAPNKTYTYDFPLTDSSRPERAGFFYYHDHRMLYTGKNNWMGLQGMFIVDNPGPEHGLGLPNGGYDVPIMIADRSFTSTNQLTNPFPAHPMMEVTGGSAPPNDATVGSKILVNGTYRPYFNVATHRYRLRLLNASNFQSYDFTLSDGRAFTQIGTGDSLLPNPVARKDILLGPSQRADVVVSFVGELHKNVVLESVARVSRPVNGTGVGTPTAQLMQFRVTRSASDTSRVPSTLRAAPWTADPNMVPSTTWVIDKQGQNSHGYYWQINGKEYDPNRVDYVVDRGATQAWRLRNDSSVTHYFHIHEEQWQTLWRDGKRPPAWEKGLQDTWRLDPGESVVVEGRFTDYLGVYMIHCHMLDHEDHGLMAQFAVVDPKTQALPAGYHLG